MSKANKIWLAIAGILLVALGIYCICNPASTLFAAAWMIGCATLVAGISKLVFTFRTQAFLPNSGSRMISSILLIILGILFLCNNLFVAVSLPLVFVLWIIVESIYVLIYSFDFKKVGFSGWWVLLLIAVAGLVFGFLGLRNPDVSAVTLSSFIGCAVALLGVGYLVALAGINRFQKQVKEFEKSIGVDQQ